MLLNLNSLSFTSRVFCQNLSPATTELSHTLRWLISFRWFLTNQQLLLPYRTQLLLHIPSPLTTTICTIIVFRMDFNHLPISKSPICSGTTAKHLSAVRSTADKCLLGYATRVTTRYHMKIPHLSACFPFSRSFSVYMDRNECNPSCADVLVSHREEAKTA